MVVCVNKSSKEFKDTAKRLNISESALELIVHKYINIAGNETSFPSDAYINSQLTPPPIYELSDNAYKLWKQKYSKPLIFSTIEELSKELSKASFIFGKDSVKTIERFDGGYELRVGEAKNRYFNLDAIDKSRVDIEEHTKPWKDNPSKSNQTIRIYLKDKHNKGYFELVKDEEDNYYSVHFKTSKEGAKYNSDLADISTKEDRKILFEELIKAIPEKAYVSTWGTLSEDGIRGLDNVGRDMIKVGEREAKLKSDNSSITIPIYQKASVFEKEASDIDTKEDIRAANIAEITASIESIKKELTNEAKKEYLNTVIKYYNDLIDKIQSKLRRSNNISSDTLSDFINEFNRENDSLISLGIVKKLSDSIGPKISKFTSDGRALYDTSKISVKRDEAAIKRFASELLKNHINSLNNQLKEEQRKLEKVKNSHSDDLYYQQSILNELNKLKQFKALKGLGSIKKIREKLKSTVDSSIANAIADAVEMDKSLLELDPYTVFQKISQIRDDKIAQDYNTYIQQKINKDLESHLINYLKKYNIEYDDFSDFAKEHSVVGVYDILGKIIHVAKEGERNLLTVPEEFAHAFVELMGSVVKKNAELHPENKDFSFLFNHVENTTIYKQVYEQYKDKYIKDGVPDIYKIKKEAIGQALATAIVNKWESKNNEETTFWQKLKSWFSAIIAKFKDCEYINFQALTNKIADEVLKNDYSRLNKVNSSNYRLLNYSETLANQNKADGGKALKFMQYFTNIGNIITGSLSYRYQGTIYRNKLDSLHDIDMEVPSSAHGINLTSIKYQAIKELAKTDRLLLINELAKEEYFKKILVKYPKLKLLAGYEGNLGSITVNAIFSDNEALSEKFALLSGPYAKRLEAFNEEERKQIYLFDFFLKPSGANTEYIVDEENSLRLATFETSFKEKQLSMGRAKDIFDYQMWKLFDEFKKSYVPKDEYLMYQSNPNIKDKSFTFDDGTTVATPFRLNSQQANALNEMDEFVKSNETSMTLSGYAGTGKTSLMEILAKKMRDDYKRIVFSATTNKAAAVLKSKVSKLGFQAHTLNKVFGISVEVDTNKEYNAKNLVKKLRDSDLVGYGDIVVIDEASMINEDNYNTLNSIAHGLGLKIIYVGDSAQLAPVKENQISIVFRNNNGRIVELTQVERTEDNAILKEATAIRNGQSLSKESSFNEKGQGVAYISSTDRQTIGEIVKRYIEGLKNNPNFFRILAYTNAAVAKYNTAARRVLGYVDSTPRVGEPMTGYTNWGYNWRDKTYRFINSESYQVTDVGKPIPYTFTLNGQSVTLEYTPVTLKDSLGKIDTFNYIDIKDNIRNREAATLLAKEKVAIWRRARAMSRREAAPLYQKINEIDALLFVNDNIVEGNNTLQSKVIDFGYALTIHKSQGSTFTNVLVDDVDIQRAETTKVSFDSSIDLEDVTDVDFSQMDMQLEEEIDFGDTLDFSQEQSSSQSQVSNVANIKQQLEYVAVSRATNTVTIISDDAKTEDSPLNHTEDKEQKNQDEYFFFSGGAIGSDSYWGDTAKKAGISTKHYTTQDFDSLSQQRKAEVENEYQEVVTKLGRKPLDASSYSGKLVRRDMLQADNADAIFAIGKLGNNGLIDGGTGYATTRGIIRGIPVHLFNQETNSWMVWDTERQQFIPENTPSLTKNAAVIGTRNLQENGKAAIDEIVSKLKEKQTPTTGTFEVLTANKVETKETTDEGLSMPQEEKIRPELIEFQDRNSRDVRQLTNLLNSARMSNSEVRYVAGQLVYAISDFITDCLENPENYMSCFESLFVNMTDEQRAAEVEKIKNMTRKEFVQYATIERLIENARVKMFTPKGNPSLNTAKKILRAKTISDNISGLMRFANDSFVINEEFSVIYTRDIPEVNENLSPLNEDYNPDTDADNVLETQGSLQEHWQVEFRTQEVIARMTQLVKMALGRCFELKLDEKGNKQHIADDWGIAKRVDMKTAISSILTWTGEDLSLEDMIRTLQNKEKENLWVSQLTEMLTDRSGKYADFQSQFYGVFSTSFQPYCIVKKEINESGEVEYHTMMVNERPARKEVLDSIKVAYQLNTMPLFDNGEVRTDTLETLKSIVGDLTTAVGKKFEENDRAQLVDLIYKAALILGYDAKVDDIAASITSAESLRVVANALQQIALNVENSIGQEGYNPFKFSVKNSIGGYINTFIGVLTEKLEETAISSVFDNGKMYQSNVTPSYLTRLMSNFRADDEHFQEFLENEYGRYEWFKTQSGWRNKVLEELDKMPQKDRKELFKHKVQLNFNKHNYMKNLTKDELALSVLTEYFSRFVNAKGTSVVTWFKVPMLSNKPSSEFISMNAYVGAMGKEILKNGFYSIFLQELSRIQTVLMRNYDKSDPNFIKNFDKNGKKFMFLDFFNDYLKGEKEENSELGKLIKKALNEGTVFNAQENKGLTIEDNKQLMVLAKDVIQRTMEARADKIVAEWKKDGIFDAAKQIQGIGKSDDVIEERLKEFVWNDTFAAMNILELTVTDIAYYKDAEDLQKRFAQIHAPGTKANIYATDYKGRRVSDGIFRTILLKDFDDFKSNIKDNLRIVFDRKLSQITDENQRKSAEILYNSIIDSFDKINVADAQGFSSPTSYRKKALLFGRWSKGAEEIYEKLQDGTYTYNDLKIAFQPLKPFVYGQIGRPSISESSEIAAPMSNLKIPVQFKNSEYLLIMADAILKGEDTGKPNLLRAIYEVMEESAKINPEAGIDTIQFESTCKSGLQAAIDIKKFYNDENGEFLAKRELERAIYKAWNTSTLEDGSTITTHTPEYNTASYVYEVPFEYYSIQQEVPAHFREHYQAHGSQIRYIVVSDLETADYQGNQVTYDYFDNGVLKKQSAKEFREEYENTIAENIRESINELCEEFGLNDPYLSRKDRNIALSKLLIEEIFNSPRYGADLAVACSINEETGEFNIPLGDPIQSKRIEQLINSVIKKKVNKQEIAGGPVVQVTNFGTSKQLNIRYKDKKGNLLMTKEEFAKTAPEGKSYNIDAAYKKYCEDNQSGIAYYEVFAPIYSNELFEKFRDREGNVDIEAIEMVNPDLLKMIGYRIPTEDKYSMAPLKIVGFLPREAGDGIMLPYEITLLTGSDFDVDKFYLMRKEFNIMERYNPKADENATEEEKEFVKKNTESLKDYMRSKILNSYRGDLYRDEIKLTEEEQNKIAKEAEIAEDIQYRRKQENKRHEETLDVLENKLDEDNLGNKAKERLNKRIESENALHEDRLKEIDDRLERKKEKLLDKARKEKLNTLIEDFLNIGPFTSSRGNELFKEMKKMYMDYTFKEIAATQGKTYRNNKIVDMTWAVLTNETTADKMLNPGGFEKEKSMGYLVSAYKNPTNKYSWEELKDIASGKKGLLDGNLVNVTNDNKKDVETGTDGLKALCYTDKNLCFIDTHLQFYQQNNAASTALGMAAVQKVAHAVLESNGYMVDVEALTSLPEAIDEETKEAFLFEIAGFKFNSMMEFDKNKGTDGTLIGRTLGEFVAMFADAVKDPVANLMNMNNTTMPIITTLVRLGMPFESAALFLSQPIITKVLADYNLKNLSGFSRLSDVINSEIETLSKSLKEEEESVSRELNSISEEQLVNNLKNPTAINDITILRMFQNIDSIANALKTPTYATRFNSISNAVGPLIVNNLAMEYKIASCRVSDTNQTNIYNKQGEQISIDDVFEAHPILYEFSRTVDIARELLSDMPTNSANFRKIIQDAPESISRILLNDIKTFSELSDFYQSYLLVASGVIPTTANNENKHRGLQYYIEQFPSDFVKLEAKKLFEGNKFVEAIRTDIQNGRLVLKLNTTGMSAQEKEKLSDGWVDLYNSGERGKKLAEHLFYYNFFRTGIGFNPKSFMGLFPTLLKSKIAGYNEAFMVHSNNYAKNVSTKLVLDQFIRNNADNNKLVPRITTGKDGYTTRIPVNKNDGDLIVDNAANLEDKPYIKIKKDNKITLYKRVGKVKGTDSLIFKEIEVLGNNGEYFEVSLDSNYKAIKPNTNISEQNKDGQIQEASIQEVVTDDIPQSTTVTKQQKTDRAKKILSKIIEWYQRAGKTADDVFAYTRRSSEEKQRLEPYMKKFFKENAEREGWKYDEKLIQEFYDSIC